MKRAFAAILVLFCAVILSSCGDGSYLWQCAKGQLDLLSRARPIDDVLASDAEPQPVREQLLKVVGLRQFAVEALHLPDSDSYRSYADLERPYAVWNLVAAPELSLDLQQWCFPVAGCVTYRGYFVESSAMQAAEDFSSRGFDVDVYGVQAYSTLNWFADPVLNTFLHNDDLRLATILFHEMAHQVVYIPNDTVFNESFAKTVEREGVRRWLIRSDAADAWSNYLEREDYSVRFHAFLDRTRTSLASLYGSGLEQDAQRAAKAEILDNALTDYQAMKAAWGGYAGFDQWMERGLNNARLSSVATYNELVPAFQQLLDQAGNDLPRFYRSVEALQALSDDERLARLKALSAASRVAFARP